MTTDDAMRFDGGKPRLDLIPAELMEELGKGNCL